MKHCKGPGPVTTLLLLVVVVLIVVVGVVDVQCKMKSEIDQIKRPKHPSVIQLLY